ncbi:fungal pheromone STE3G-protein-coupled receptor [Gymnopus androsaceus JB14]|uniref:Fungal pheromone STE3G-protein-coupled receptor n=1 Tax=Gymnopus androsaceus JB14 TaxID=1447944 RepID=A0A6A4HAQ9_9AGAR|nr:fungal pheromone STE3G-protein-coupled receptor [Gymnopus androsaceus JB14]
MAVLTDPSLNPSFFTVLSFFSFLLPLIPLTWHFQAWNSGCFFYMAWASLLGLVNFVNSVVWAGTVQDVSPVWCDISTHANLAGTFGTILSAQTIIRRLYIIASARSPLTHTESRRALIEDTIPCVVIPVIFVALQYVVQDHRYAIYEEFGCLPSTYRTLASELMIDLPPVLTGIVIAYFDVRCLLILIHDHEELKDFFASINAGSFLSNRFIPIVAFTIVEVIITFPTTLFDFVLNITTGLQPWGNWNHVHASFSVIPVFPSTVWMVGDKSAIASLLMDQWSNSICGVLIFLLFGTTEEARRHYSMAFWRLFRRREPLSRTTISDKRYAYTRLKRITN